MTGWPLVPLTAAHHRFTVFFRLNIVLQVFKLQSIVWGTALWGTLCVQWCVYSHVSMSHTLLWVVNISTKAAHIETLSPACRPLCSSPQLFTINLFLTGTLFIASIKRRFTAQLITQSLSVVINVTTNWVFIVVVWLYLDLRLQRWTLSNLFSHHMKHKSAQTESVVCPSCVCSCVSSWSPCRSSCQGTRPTTSAPGTVSRHAFSRNGREW